MKKKERNPLKQKLLEAVNTVLEENKIDFSKKLEKVVKKSVRRIVKKADKQIKKAIKRK